MSDADYIAAETCGGLSRSVSRLPENPLSSDLHGIPREVGVTGGGVDPHTNPTR